MRCSLWKPEDIDFAEVPGYARLTDIIRQRLALAGINAQRFARGLRHPKGSRILGQGEVDGRVLNRKRGHPPFGLWYVCKFSNKIEIRKHIPNDDGILWWFQTGPGLLWESELVEVSSAAWVEESDLLIPRCGLALLSDGRVALAYSHRATFKQFAQELKGIGCVYAVETGSGRDASYSYLLMGVSYGYSLIPNAILAGRRHHEGRIHRASKKFGFGSSTDLY